MTTPKTAAAAAKPDMAATRRAARLAAVQTLYQLGFGQEHRDGVHVDDGEQIAAPHQSLMKEIVLTAMDRHATIDEILSQSLDSDWPLMRLDQVLRAILRAGVAEVLMQKKTPVPIMISDYVDVAHAFFSGKEPGMVNAVLDRVAKKLRSSGL
jgi:transcription antitermination protein NusB